MSKPGRNKLIDQTLSPRRNQPISSVLVEFSEDELYKEFLEDSFNVSTFTSHSMEKRTTQEDQQKLLKGIHKLQNEINGQVIAKIKTQKVTNRH